MRRLLHIFVFVTLLGFALSGCRQSAAERRLVEIDTLIARGTYDTALLRLRAIDTTTLSRDELAYHGLLMAHAAYKSFADSICFDTTWIARARAAYADGGLYDRHIRTLLYSGCVAKELGDPLAAMRWYKKTELNAKGDDHFSLGYALMAMGSLYQNEYKNKEAINKYLPAVQHLSLSGDTSYLLFCDLQLCRNYCLFNADSAEYYGNEVRSLARAANNEQYYYQSLQVKAADLFNKERYAEAISFSQTVISEAPQFADYACWLYAAISYLNVGNLDSARLCFSHAPQPASLNDTLLYYQWESACYAQKGDSVASVRFEKMAGERSELEILNTRESRLKPVELKCEKEYENSKKHSVGFYVSLASIFLLLVLPFAWFFMKRHRRVKKERDNYKELSTALEKQLKEIEQGGENGNNASVLQQNREIFGHLAKAYRSLLTQLRKHENEKGLVSLDEVVKITLTDKYFQNLYGFVNLTHDDLADKLTASGKLSKREINVICLHLCHLPNSIISTYADIRPHSITKLKNDIATKYFGRDAKIDEFLQIG